MREKIAKNFISELELKILKKRVESGKISKADAFEMLFNNEQSKIRYFLDSIEKGGYAGLETKDFIENYLNHLLESGVITSADAAIAQMRYEETLSQFSLQQLEAGIYSKEFIEDVKNGLLAGYIPDKRGLRAIGHAKRKRAGELLNRLIEGDFSTIPEIKNLVAQRYLKSSTAFEALLYGEQTDANVLYGLVKDGICPSDNAKKKLRRYASIGFLDPEEVNLAIWNSEKKFN